MMKICIMGDSHVGALKKAWNKLSRGHQKVALTFFASRGAGMASLKIEGGCLVPGTEVLKKSMGHTSDGLDRIDPQKYDLFLIYGLGARPDFVENERQFFSSQVRARSLHDLITGTLSFQLLNDLRKLTDHRIYVGHSPLKAAKSTKGDSDGPSTKPAAYLAGIANLNEAAYKPLNAELFAQPIATIVDGKFTNPAYGQGSTRLAIGVESDDQPHQADENRHMNDEFGRIWLSAFLEHISGK